MRLLLDTHALIWFLLGSKRLSGKARRAIGNSRNRIFISAVSGYELALKASHGEIEQIVIDDMSYALSASQFESLAIDMGHMIVAGGFGDAHKDPWDRILAAQAKAEGLTLVTAGNVFSDFGVQTLW